MVTNNHIGDNYDNDDNIDDKAIVMVTYGG